MNLTLQDLDHIKRRLALAANEHKRGIALDLETLGDMVDLCRLALRRNSPSTTPTTKKAATEPGHSELLKEDRALIDSAKEAYSAKTAEDLSTAA